MGMNLPHIFSPYKVHTMKRLVSGVGVRIRKTVMGEWELESMRRESEI